MAQVFIVGKEFIGHESICLIHGDNIFYGHNFARMLKEAVRTVEEENKATVFGYSVQESKQYRMSGLAEGNIKRMEENSKLNYAVVGLYVYPNRVVEMAKKMKPSARGKLEMTTVNREFLQAQELKLQLLSNSCFCLAGYENV